MSKYKKGDKIKVSSTPNVGDGYEGKVLIISEYLYDWKDDLGEWYRFVDENGEFEVNLPECDFMSIVKNNRLAKKMFPNAEESEDGEWLYV